ncbi:MAG: IPTL-CTERM sorting domain-containing protein [Caulobacterales bacterium]|nr:IPTL-CTERM sorting domain-containing protein [Caulobacterales bacterium]
MHKSLFFAILIAACLMANAALAQSFDNRPGPGNNITILDPTLPGSEALGQVITVPAGQGFINTIGFETIGSSGAPVFRAMIFPWNGTNSVSGAAIFDSGPLTNPASLTTINTGAVPVTPGQQYVILVTMTQDATAGSVALGIYLNNTTYALGASVVQSDNNNSLTDPWFVQSFDMAFRVSYSPAPSVPTMSEWAVILFGLMLVGGGAIWLSRRRQDLAL